MVFEKILEGGDWEKLGGSGSEKLGVARGNWEKLGETQRNSEKLGEDGRVSEKLGETQRRWEGLGGRGEGTEKAAYGFRQLFVIITCVV